MKKYPSQKIQTTKNILRINIFSNRALSARPRRQRERLRVASRLQSDVKQLHDFVSFKASYLNLAVQYSQPQTQIPNHYVNRFR